jgi:hypothetical protein
MCTASSLARPENVENKRVNKRQRSNVKTMQDKAKHFERRARQAA